MPVSKSDYEKRTKLDLTAVVEEIDARLERGLSMPFEFESPIHLNNEEAAKVHLSQMYKDVGWSWVYVSFFSKDWDYQSGRYYGSSRYIRIEMK